MILGKGKFKATMKYHITPARMATIQEVASVVKDMQKLEPLDIGRRTVKLGSHHGKE